MTFYLVVGNVVPVLELKFLQDFHQPANLIVHLNYLIKYLPQLIDRSSNLLDDLFHRWTDILLSDILQVVKVQFLFRVHDLGQVLLNVFYYERMVLLAGAVQKFCLKKSLLWAFFVKLTMLVIIGAKPPEMFKKPFRKAAAVFMHRPSSEEYVLRSCLYDE